MAAGEKSIQNSNLEDVQGIVISSEIFIMRSLNNQDLIQAPVNKG